MSRTGGGSTSSQRKLGDFVPTLFLQRWMLGAKITLHTLILGAFVLFAGGLLGCLVYAVCIILPAEAVFHTTAPEHYWIAAFIFGCAVWGVEGIGKARRILSETFIE